jgi:hypothetical protein
VKLNLSLFPTFSMKWLDHQRRVTESVWYHITWVPTGMNIGVWQTPCGSVKVAALALFHVAWILKRKNYFEQKLKQHLINKRVEAGTSNFKGLFSTIKKIFFVNFCAIRKF